MVSSTCSTMSRWLTAPVRSNRRSASVDLPWSMWAMMQKFRICSWGVAIRLQRLEMEVREIPVQTPKGEFTVWTERHGDNPRAKLLLLHGGPGATHEYFECCEDYLPAAGIEFIYYDQLGSALSDQPDEPDLWEIPRFVDEVEQVRQALGLGPDNFFLLGHSWGGILATE